MTSSKPFGRPSKARARRNLRVLGRHYRRVLREFRDSPVKLLTGPSRVHAVDVSRGLKLVELRKRRGRPLFDVVDVSDED